jgi:hypothetical protein
MAKPGDKYFYRRYGARIDDFLKTIKSRSNTIKNIQQHLERAEEILSILPRKERKHLQGHVIYLKTLQDKYVFEVNLAGEGIREIVAEQEIDKKNIAIIARNRRIPVSQLLTEFEMVNLPQSQNMRPEISNLEDEDRDSMILWYRSLRSRGWERREAYRLATSPYENISMAEINRVYSEIKGKK